jgi:hypothetical protein
MFGEKAPLRLAAQIEQTARALAPTYAQYNACLLSLQMGSIHYRLDKASLYNELQSAPFCHKGDARGLPPQQDKGRARTAGSRFAHDDKEPGPSCGKLLPGERHRETAET